MFPVRTVIWRVPLKRFRHLIALVVLLAAAAPSQALPTSTVRTPCDDFDTALCLLPFPNDRFTTPDPTMDTGKRIDLLLPEMPRAISGKPIDPTEWNRNDGFSPGSMVLTFVPGLDLHQTWGTAGLSTGGANDPADHIADIARYEAPDAPILIIDQQTGERWPFWSELDMNSGTAPDERLLILRPAKNFLEGHTYAVALRNMKASNGSLIPAGGAFASLRDGDGTPLEADRNANTDRIINEVATAEVNRGNAFFPSDLFLAWDFTIASERNLSERVLHIRDEAFAALGDTNLANSIIEGAAPAFTITKVTNITTDARKQRQVEGTVRVPYYIDRPPYAPIDKDPVAGLPGQAVPTGRFLYGSDGLPEVNPAIPTIDAPFVCTIPKTASAGNKAHSTLYGHGLLGSRGESTGGSTDRMRERNYMPCATNWFGFAEQDVANALVTLTDPSNMASMMDRSQQGFLNQLILGRVIAHPNGLASNAAFQDGSGTPLYQTNDLVYDGNSQGGIMGGALTALAVDHTRATLGVVGMNYSTLLNRSSDWEGPIVNPEEPGLPSYASFLYTQFPNKMEQQLVFGLLQMLWDRGEADGYAQHMTDDPYDNTPAHQVLLHVAVGDYQVTNVSAEVEARTIGARVMDTALMAGRNWTADNGFFDLPSMPRIGSDIAPYQGSVLVYWDSGNYRSPNANIPPLTVGGDPHEDPRRDPRGGDQKAHFFQTGNVIDVMSGGPYLTCRPGYGPQIPRVPSEFTFDWCV